MKPGKLICFVHGLCLPFVSTTICFNDANALHVTFAVVEQTEGGAHPQGTSAPAVPFGRHGGGGRERVAMEGGLAGSSTPAAAPEILTAGSGGVSGVAPTNSLGRQPGILWPGSIHPPSMRRDFF